MTMRIICLALALCIGFAHVAAQASEIDALVKQLGGADPVAQSLARQLLPRESVEAVPKLVVLVQGDDQAVWRAANNVLADFANQAVLPGREADRKYVTDALMVLVAPGKPAEIKERGLRLLPLVVPSGYDVSPIAALLTDAELREPAREALEVIGTPEASAALAIAISSAEPDFAVALLNSLDRLDDPANVPLLSKLMNDQRLPVAIAAARALADTGDPAFLPAYRGLMERAWSEKQREAGGAAVQYLHAMAQRGGNWQLAMDLFRELLEGATDPVIQSAAIAGLGKYGDESVVDDIMRAIKGSNGRDLEPPALLAFRALRGPGAVKALLAAYPNLNDDMQVGMIFAFAEKNDPAVMPVLTAAAASGDALQRHAVLEALGQSQMPGAVAVLAAALASGDEDDKSTAVNGLTRLAQVLRDSGNKNEAGQAYLALYRVTDSDEAKQFALSGIKDCPVPEAFDVILADIDTAALDSLSPSLLAGMAKALRDAGRVEDAEKATDALLARADNAEAVQLAIDALRGSTDAREIAHTFGFVTSWSLVGPFPWTASEAFQHINVNEPDVDLAATYTVGDKNLAWKPYQSPDAAGIVNLAEILGMPAGAAAYGFATINVDKDTDAVVRVGSDDGVKVWVNGEVVHENNVDRGMAMDQDQAPIKLLAGDNTLLVEITQGGGGWGFCVRLTQPDGKPLLFTNE
ncbi:MAG: HEAT repeat domain-containing protein [Candidatus Hydrogenedentes bacterium]|nr:HEAT repeat domain-containing protein [Candidatus Hydrogenedentota bacterium]